ncbi:hypothetical protein Bhyg_09591 [Pseudolycoriella hygida]|uniref:Uncharacterized protein n=1 Tax=Pseudolycoriella hygida TaxID=35572 RepID=A0A9Q0S439_9DIPT|nr:hypothetical protein Bhyg_09591 [Pseudolycoriella hygida]
MHVTFISPFISLFQGVNIPSLSARVVHTPITNIWLRNDVVAERLKCLDETNATVHSCIHKLNGFEIFIQYTQAKIHTQTQVSSLERLKKTLKSNVCYACFCANQSIPIELITNIKIVAHSFKLVLNEQTDDSRSFWRIVKRLGLGREDRNFNPPFTADDFNVYMHGIGESLANRFTDPLPRTTTESSGPKSVSFSFKNRNHGTITTTETLE